MLSNKTKDIAVKTVLVTAILWMLTTSKGAFHKLVKFQRVRGTDGYGSGAFLASRKHEGDHNGLDIITIPGEPIYSPVNGVIKRYSFPYGIEAGLSGYHILTEKYLIKLWYLSPSQLEGAKITRGQIIGYAQSLQQRYPGITNHSHIEVWDLKKTNVAIDPTTLF